MDNSVDGSSLSPPRAADAPPKAEVDDFLRRKRKVREHKACYPCRQRKVRCDLGRPCKTCVEREHPELCDYHPPAKKQNLGGANSGEIRSDEHQSSLGSGTIMLAQSDFQHLCRKLESVENTIEDLRREMKNNGNNGINHQLPAISGRSSPNGSSRLDAPRLDNSFLGHASVHGLHTQNDLTGQTIHIGGSSVPALVMALGQGNREQPSVQNVLGRSILPIFGLDNESATYPFVDLWGLAHGSLAKAEQLAKTIPNDSQCLGFFHYYRDMGHVIYPGVADPASFETELSAFLMTRSSYLEMGVQGEATMPGITEQSIYDKDLHWIGLMFAVLASGCQCSGLPRKERELTSQVYVCCSFECLRFTNYLSHPTLLNVQTLLVLGNVISNNMNAGTAWNLLGTTVRLAQSLGLHQSCPPPVASDVKALRSKIWWTLMWQDSLLSISYDRASSTALMDHSSMAMPYLHTPLPAFQASMYRLCKVGLDIVRDRSRSMSSREHLTRISKTRDEMDTIMGESAEYLRDYRKCRSLRDSVEHWVLYLHTSYIMSELCRPAISPSTADPELAKRFKQVCLDSLVNVVDAFLGLQNITTYARRSWASVHRALSSALLLGIVGEQNQNERCRKLLGRFVALMGDMTNSIHPQEIAAPMERAINSLRKLNIWDLSQLHQSPTTSESKHGNNSNVSNGSMVAPTAPLRFMDDIAMGGSATTNTPDSGSSGKMEHSYLPAGAGGVQAQDSAEEDSPYSVLNSILWGKG